MAASMMLPECDCNDYLKFQEMLKKMRILDDRIIYSLNKSVPTQSFAGKVDSTSKCQSLYDQMIKAHSMREQAIKKCVNEITDHVHTLQKHQRLEPNNFEIVKELRKEQSKLHRMRSELSIEEIVRDRSYKAFHEKCGSVVRTPTAPIL